MPDVSKSSPDDGAAGIHRLIAQDKMKLANVGCAALKIATQEDRYEDNAAKREMKHYGVERYLAKLYWTRKLSQSLNANRKEALPGDKDNPRHCEPFTR